MGIYRLAAIFSFLIFGQVYGQTANVCCEGCTYTPRGLSSETASFNNEVHESIRSLNNAYNF